jgi:ubiquinone/menaquinone biosynthesis C-methylase UbiE
MRETDYKDLYALEEDFWWFVGMRDITASLLDPLCPPSKKNLILDAGCGTGVMLSWLERYTCGEKVFGADLVKDALDFCRQRGHRNLVQASVTHLPFADRTFDLVTSFDVLVQLPGEDSDELAIREMYRVLRPQGIAFVRAAAYRWMHSGHDRALSTQRRYGLHELTKKMERSGFYILRSTYANSLLFPFAAVRRLLLKPIGLADKGSDVKPLSRALQPLNRAFISILRKEARILQNPQAKIPAGLSAICLAKKIAA